jgi:elongation factor Tu
MFRKLLDDGMAGDNAGLLLRGIEKDDLERGMVLASPAHQAPHKKFKGSSVRLDERRRRTSHSVLQRLPPPVLLPYDRRDRATLAAGTEMVMPGDNVTIDRELITPIAMEKELRFAIREGGRTVGAGRVTKIIE